MLVSVLFEYVDTEGRDEAANLTELDSDYSEPGKHVWPFDMMDVLYVCSSSSFHKHGYISICVWLYFMQASFGWAPYDNDWTTPIMWWHDGWSTGIVEACQ